MFEFIGGLLAFFAVYHVIRWFADLFRGKPPQVDHVQPIPPARKGDTADPPGSIWIDLESLRHARATVYTGRISVAWCASEMAGFTTCADGRPWDGITISCTSITLCPGDAAGWTHRTISLACAWSAMPNNQGTRVCGTAPTTNGSWPCGTNGVESQGSPHLC